MVYLAGQHCYNVCKVAILNATSQEFEKNGRDCSLALPSTEGSV